MEGAPQSPDLPLHQRIAEVGRKRLKQMECRCAMMQKRRRRRAIHNALAHPGDAVKPEAGRCCHLAEFGIDVNEGLVRRG